jgi:gliding motility-associated-like protein
MKKNGSQYEHKIGVMKRLFVILLRLLFFLLPALLAIEQAGAQSGNVVNAGQTSELSVVEIEGDSYHWELYSDATGVNFAKTSGNCPVEDAYFVGASSGPTVTVMWASPGLYFFKVTAYGPSGCMNLKVGKMEVLQPIPTAEFAEVSPICFGEIAVLTVMLEGTPPFALTYTDGVNVVTLDNIMDHTVDILVTPSTTTSYWITNVVDVYGFPNTEPVGPVVVTVYPLPDIISLIITNAIDGQPNGLLEVIASTAALPLEYSIDGVNYQDSRFISGLLPGDYIVWVRDANGCIAKMPFMIQNIVTGHVELIAGELPECLFSIVEIPVITFGFENITGFILELEFDEDILEFINITRINPALDLGMISSYNPKAGSLVIGFESAVPITIPPDERLFYMEFMGIGVGISELDWQLPQCVFLAAGGYPIPTIYTHGAVEVMPSPKLQVLGEGRYCEGEALTLYAHSLDNQNVSYIWQGPNGMSFNGAEWPLGYLGLNHTGVYTLVAANTVGCDTIVELSVLVNPIPEVSIGDDIVCIEEPIWLEPGIGYTAYLWQDGSVQAQYHAITDGNYWVEVTDQNGCTNIATVTLVPCDIELLIPNAFTPNGDGLNDEFGPIVPQVVLENYMMQIFNKWGQLLYETRDISKGWDGTFNGKLSSVDVYTYVITYELPSYFRDRVPRQVHGSVMLLR